MGEVGEADDGPAAYTKRFFEMTGQQRRLYKELETGEPCNPITRRLARKLERALTLQRALAALLVEISEDVADLRDDIQSAMAA